MPLLNARRLQWFLFLTVGFATATRGQIISIPIPVGLTLSGFSGTASGEFGSDVVTLEGTGTAGPYGKAQLYGLGQGKSLTLNLTFANGDEIIAQGPVVSNSDRSFTLNMTIFSGWGQFQGASGSMTISMTCDGDCVGKNDTDFNSPFAMSGSGSVYGPFVNDPSLPPPPPPPTVSTNVKSMFAQINASAPAPQAQFGLSVTVGSQPVQVDETVDMDNSSDGGCPGLSGLVILPPGYTNIATANTVLTTQVDVTVQDDQLDLFYWCQGSATVNAAATDGGDSMGPFSLKDDAASPALTLTIPISILVTNGPYLEVSPGGLQFVTEEGSEQTLTQYIGVTNGAPGPLPFLVYGNVQSGRNWLLLQTTSGTAQESPMPVEIQANTTGLAAGNYFAQIFIQGQGASNSDQVVEIALTVLPANATVLPSISPTGLIFTAGGDSNPASQTIQVSTPSSATMTLAATPAEDNGTGWLEITSSSESVSGSAPGSVTVAVNTGSLTAGVYTGSILLQLNSGSTYPVPVILVVPATSSPASAPLSAAKAVHSAAAQSACAPTQLLPLSTSLGSNFKVTAGLPVPLTVQVTDDCGNPLTSGSVIANFAGGDPTVTLIKSGNGTWTGTWWPRNVAGGLSAVVFNATLFSPSLSGTTAVAGSVAANASVPIVGSGRVLSAASYAPGTPLSPGSFVAIFGSNLASGTSVALGMPLSTTLAGTQVYLGSNLLPLQYVSPTQINAIVPYNAPVGAVQQLTVLRNGSPSPPETVIVTAAQPAVFTQDESGAGAASVVDVKPDGTQFVVTAANPASAGDTLLIYCTGLGAVTPAVPAGSVSPTGSPTNTTTLASVSIGGQTAQVSFSGLAPGYTGLYEVKAVVPSGISAGASVPLVVSMGSTSGGPVSSPPVTIAIQ